MHIQYARSRSFPLTRAGGPCLISSGAIVTSSTPVSWPVSNVVPGTSAPSTNLLQGGCTLVPAGAGLVLTLTTAPQWVKAVVLTVAAGTPVVEGEVYLYLTGQVRRW